jgi:hypothetical protein
MSFHLIGKPFAAQGIGICVPSMQASCVHWTLGNIWTKQPNFFGELGGRTAMSGKNHDERKWGHENQPPDMHLNVRLVSKKVTKLSLRATTPVGPVPRTAATFTNRHKGASKQYVSEDIIMNAYLSQHVPMWRYSSISARP